MFVKYKDPPFMVSYTEDSKWKSVPFKNLDDAIEFSRCIRKNSLKEDSGFVNITQQTSEYHVTTYIDGAGDIGEYHYKLNFTINKDGVVIP